MAKKPKRLTHADRVDRRKRMAEKLAAGWSLGRVARHYGVSVRLVQAARQEHRK